jgi:hypothetical protein
MSLESPKEGSVPDIREMMGKEVEVIANGVTYQGVLVEVSDMEVHLKTMFQWVALSTQSVGQIKLRETARASVADTIEQPEEVSDWQIVEEPDETTG